MTEALSPLSPEALTAHVIGLLEQEGAIPKEHRGALVAVVNLDYVQIAVATKLTDTWSVALTIRQEWHGDAVIEGQIKRSW